MRNREVCVFSQMPKMVRDQSMVMGSIGNVLGGNIIRRAFSTPDVERALRPVIGVEEFGAGIA